MNETPDKPQPEAPATSGNTTTPPSGRSIAFWVGVALAVAAFAERIADVLPAEHAIQAAAVAGVIYKIAPLIKAFFAGGEGK